MLLLQGVFRSGTTALFRALRQDQQLRCFYEPLHPNLLDHAREAEAGNPDHPKSSLYAEYTPVLSSLHTHIGRSLPDWPSRLKHNDEVPTLTEYLQILQGDGEALLQFNRAFWMIPWLARTFPEASFVHLVRDPRSVVWSQLTTSSGRVRMDWPLLGRLLPFSSGTQNRVFSKHAYFGAYQLDEYFQAGKRILNEGPSDDILHDALRRLEEVDNAPPYVKALAVWGAQIEICQNHVQAAFGDRSLLLRYEDFCKAPTDHLSSVYAALDRPVPDTVHSYARHTIDAGRLRKWTDVPSAEQRFQKGAQQARITDLMRNLGYDPT